MKDQFDHIENKIKEAARHYRPDFDESAWKKMEQLLDAKKKDRRKNFFPLIIFLCGLLAGAGLLYFFTGNKHNGQAVYNSNDYSGKIYHSAENIIPNGKQEIQEKSIPVAAGAIKNTLTENALIANSHRPLISRGDNKIVLPFGSIKERFFLPEKISGDQKSKTTADITPATVQTDDITTTDNTPGATTAGKKPDTIDEDIAAEKKNIIKETEKPADIRKSASVKKRAGEIGDFYLLASAGTENTGTGFMSFKNSRMTGKYGLEAGYNISKRFSVQIGFYGGHKIYKAAGKDYNPKTGSFLSTVKIISLDADCTVYELPVSLRYDFIAGKKNKYYAVAGISSYFMKKEDYQYRYIRNNRYYDNPYTYTGNKHFAAALRLSAGMEKKISGKFSLQAAPSVSVPLSGVGDGSVKLFSAGFNLGLKYFPFRKK